MTIIGVDVGGTFTDIILMDSETGLQFVHKVPTTPESQDRAVIQGILETLENHGLDPKSVSLVVHGTTVATNAMLERKGARVVLVTTAGLEDVIEIGRQDRDEIYSLIAARPQPLVKRDDRVGLKERLDHQGTVLEALSEEEIENAIAKIRERGPESVAVSLLFSYANPSHEQRVHKQLEESLDAYVVSSSRVLPEFREFERTSTTILEAYLGPLVVGYLKRLDASLGDLCKGGKLAVMQSNGGTILASEARGNAIGLAISGLAGGAIGGHQIAQQASLSRIITLDMGGTSCDISAIDGEVVIRSDNTVGGLPLRTPSVDVKTIGAGGGSIAWLDQAGVLHVGPQSAGAVPGPASYGKGGTQATVTDANLVIGRLNPDYFLGGAVSLDPNLAEDAVRRLAETLGLSIQQTALGIVRISTANMVQAIREVTVEQGKDPREFVLVPFGGAGPTQGVDIAEALGMREMLVPPHPGITSALGLICADLRTDIMQSLIVPADPENVRLMYRSLLELSEDASKRLLDQGAKVNEIQLEWTIDMRYSGQSHELNAPINGRDIESLLKTAHDFHRIHKNAYGYSLERRNVEWVTARVSAKAPLTSYHPHTLEVTNYVEPFTSREVVLPDEAREEVDVYRRDLLGAGSELGGPSIIEQLDTTVYIGRNWRAKVLKEGSLQMRRSV